jgi:hypothetical protein
MDGSRKDYMSGKATASNVASRQITIAYRVLQNLLELRHDDPWNRIPAPDRKWLTETKPKISRSIANDIRDAIGNGGTVSKDVALWISQYATPIEQEEGMATTCEKMKPGEQREFKGEGGKYTIFVKKTADGNFIYHVVTRDGVESNRRRTSDCKEILAKAHAAGGAIVGARDVAGAINNPAKLTRLKNSADKYFASRPKPKSSRKSNPPRLPRQSAEEGDIRELTGMVGITSSPEESYRYGYYAGIIRGIDTCGVQNFLKRKRIRNEYQERLLAAAAEATARLTGTRSGYVERKKKSAAQIYQEEADGVERAESFAAKARARVASKLRGKEEEEEEEKAEAEVPKPKTVAEAKKMAKEKADKEKAKAAKAKAKADGSIWKDLRDSVADAVGGKSARAKPKTKSSGSKMGTSAPEPRPTITPEIINSDDELEEIIRRMNQE